MTVDNMIAIGSLLATVFSALAAAFAVKQSKLQRTTLTKPQLIVADIAISVRNKSDEIFPVSPIDDELTGNFKVPLKNVGLGTALNLRYSWNFDYNEALDACGFLRSEKHQMEILELGEDRGNINNSVYIENKKEHDNYYVSFFKNNIYRSYSVKRSHTDIEYVIPITQDKSPTTLTLPYLIPILTINKIETLNPTNYMMHTGMDSGTLKLEYEDISGNKFLKIFSCSVRLLKYSYDSQSGAEALYELRINRVKKTHHIKKLLDKISLK